jgi:hypothetical protein
VLAEARYLFGASPAPFQADLRVAVETPTSGAARLVLHHEMFSDVTSPPENTKVVLGPASLATGGPKEAVVNFVLQRPFNRVRCRLWLGPAFASLPRLLDEFVRAPGANFQAQTFREFVLGYLHIHVPSQNVVPGATSPAVSVELFEYEFANGSVHADPFGVLRAATVRSVVAGDHQDVTSPTGDFVVDTTPDV